MAHKRRLWHWLLLGASIWRTSAASAQADSELYFDVTLRGTGSATIHAEVYENSCSRGGGARGRGDITILAVHGFTERGSMFEPLAEAIFADAGLSRKVARIVSLDLIAHGLSSPPTLPPPLTFGDLFIEDNAQVVIQAIGYLKQNGMGPQLVMGHSMGGLTIQAAQEALLSQGSSLRDLGVKKAALLAAVPGRGTAWTRFPGPDPTPFITFDPVLGLILDLPAASCGSAGGFTTLAGTLVASAPSPATCIANDWIGPEPIATVLELTGQYCDAPPDDPSGSPFICRPFVRNGAFAQRNGTTLSVIGFSQDVLSPMVDQGGLYEYLTGKSSSVPGSLFRPVVADDAVHSMYISRPEAVADELRKLIQ